MSCPCGLTQERVLEVAKKHGVPLAGGLCQNPFIKPDGTLGICGKPLGAHPSAPITVPATEYVTKEEFEKQKEDFKKLKKDFLDSQTIDWKDIGSSCFSVLGTVAGLGCMVAQENKDAVFYGGVASTSAGLVGGLYSTGTMMRKKSASAKVHTL